MIETFVLTVLENVLGNYIADVLSKRRSRRTRTEVIREVSERIKETAAIGQQIDALAVAVRELDALIREGAPLRWKRDELVVERPSRLIKLRPDRDSPERALARLHEAVALRRRQLDQASIAEQTAAVEDGPEQPFRLVTDEDAGGSTPPRLGPWGHRVMDLESEVRRQRRDTQRED